MWSSSQLFAVGTVGMDTLSPQRQSNPAVPARHWFRIKRWPKSRLNTKVSVPSISRSQSKLLSHGSWANRVNGTNSNTIDNNNIILFMALSFTEIKQPHHPSTVAKRNEALDYMGNPLEILDITYYI